MLIGKSTYLWVAETTEGEFIDHVVAATPDEAQDVVFRTLEIDSFTLHPADPETGKKM